MATGNPLSGSLSGPLGPLLFRHKKRGGTVVVPRYRHDARTALQLEQRRRFRLVTKIASKIYLQTIKPYQLSLELCGAGISIFTDTNMSGYEEVHAIPSIVLSRGELPAVVDMWVAYRQQSGELWLYWDVAANPGYGGSDVVRVVSVASNQLRVWASDAIPFSQGFCPLWPAYGYGHGIYFWCTASVIRNSGLYTYRYSVPYGKYGHVS
jgi:hypothetical protein